MSDTSSDRPSIDDIKKATDGHRKELAEQHPDAPDEQIGRAEAIRLIDKKVDEFIEKQNRPPKWARDLMDRVEATRERIEEMEKQYDL